MVRSRSWTVAVLGGGEDPQRAVFGQRAVLDGVHRVEVLGVYREAVHGGVRGAPGVVLADHGQPGAALGRVAGTVQQPSSG